MAQDWRQTRLYTRYPFSAAAEIGSSGAQMPSRAMNISFGGCRLLSERALPVGAAITVTIRTSTDAFEATAKVAYSGESDVGVMFDKVSPRSLLVLKKWISAASEGTAPTTGRRARRYRFVVNIELTDLQSEVHFQERTADLSLYGCRVLARKPFPAGTKVRIRITQRGLAFAALGKVVYVAPNGQMGIIFTQVEASDQAALETWIGELRAG